MGHMFVRFLAILNEAISREGVPLPCRLDFILTVTSFPRGLPWWLRVAGRALTVSHFLAPSLPPDPPLPTSSHRANGMLSLVLICTSLQAPYSLSLFFLGSHPRPDPLKCEFPD